MATQYTIKYDGWNSMYEDFGDDLVYFNSTAYQNDNPDVTFPIILPFKLIRKQAEKMYPGVEDIIRQAKSHLRGWGPQESVIVNEMEALGIDLEAVVLQVIATKVDMKKERKRIDAIDTCLDQMPKIFETFEILVAASKTETITYNSLCAQFEKMLTNEVVDQFPVILNSSSDCIIQLRQVLAHHIPALVRDLTKLINEAEKKKI